MSSCCKLSLLGAVTAAIVVCSDASASSPFDVPATLRPPADQSSYLEAHATGVQIYVCTAKPGATYEWVFKAPEATLMDASGKTIGKHYAGPTWEANDGSKVVGELKAKDPGPYPAAIPWLLLTAKSNTGAGVFSAARSIQRVDTTGGQPPPAEICMAASVKQIARVAYTATYFFYRAQ